MGCFSFRTYAPPCVSFLFLAHWCVYPFCYPFLTSHLNCLKFTQGTGKVIGTHVVIYWKSIKMQVFQKKHRCHCSCIWHHVKQEPNSNFLESFQDFYTDSSSSLTSSRTKVSSFLLSHMQRQSQFKAGFTPDHKVDARSKWGCILIGSHLERRGGSFLWFFWYQELLPSQASTNLP